jgi:hypothetical protein
LPAASEWKESRPWLSRIVCIPKLEKLEFALAVALTRGDQQRSSQLREQIEALGGNCEEPGT